MSGLVTGDAVVLGLHPARLPSRALAVVIDLVVVWTAYLLVSIGLAVATAALDEAAVMAVSIAAFLLVLVGGPIVVETLSHGRSLGKMACGLRVVRDDGGPVRFRHALVRGAMSFVEILLSFGVIACIASLVSGRGRRIGDVFAGTLVVRERVPVPRGTTAVPPPPPWLAGRFGDLDLSAVPDGLWLGIRQYLTRMGQLDTGVSWSMAHRLVDDLVARTGTSAPQGVPPAAYLAAVLHERQARDARRAFATAGTAHVRQGAGVGPGTVHGAFPEAPGHGPGGGTAFAAGHGGPVSPQQQPRPGRGSGTDTGAGAGPGGDTGGGDTAGPVRTTGFAPPA